MATVETQAAPDQVRVAPSSLAPLPGGEWRVWRSVCVRGAGFPAEMLQRLAAPASAHAADAWIRADRRVAALKAERRRASRPQRAGPPAPPHAPAIAEALRDAVAHAAQARAALEQAFASDAARTSGWLRDAIGDPRLREAVLWQNRRAVHTGFDPLLRAPAARMPSERAVKERLAASYLQRYCVKNDTIGFFGPVAWARIVDGGPAVRVDPGPRLIASRAVHFEGWAIDALARALNARPDLRPWTAPRLLPQVRIDGTCLCIPGRDPVPIGPVHARLLRLCDGRRPARLVARELAGDPATGLRRESDVYALVDAFEQMGLVIWSLEVPLERDPERGLRAQLSRIDDPVVRASCLAALDALESSRAAVARAAGDAEALDRALDALDATFTRLTATSATRSPGETYAARTLVYEDCRRDVRIELGPPLLDRLGPPLSLLLESARWCTWEIARRYRAELASIVGRLVARAGAAGLDLSAVLGELDLGGKGQMPAPIAEIHAELRRRWMAVLAVNPQEREARRQSADLRPRVAEAFEAPAPGWTWARHVSPDLMIAAAGADAVARGDYLAVLGELHLTNTLLQTALVSEHPDPQELLRALDTDFPAPTAVPVQSRETFTDRTAMGRRPSRAFWYESSREIAPGPRERVLCASDLFVERDRGGALWVSARDGRARFDALDFLGYFLTLKCATMFGLLPDAPHMPRIRIDEVVVSRERWQAPAAALDWASAPTPLERFLGARRWVEALGIPRLAFVKVPVERKPCYVDFDSPIYVDILAKLARKSAASAAPAGPVTITEMLPAPDQLWLVDAEGRRYTSELRLLAVDPRAAGPSIGPARGAQP